jgi:hypothetical protein
MQKTDEWLEKYNQETALLQTQLDKLKSARATDLATYQRIAADVREMEKWVLCNCFVFLILVYSIRKSCP